MTEPPLHNPQHSCGTASSPGCLWSLGQFNWLGQLSAGSGVPWLPPAGAEPALSSAWWGTWDAGAAALGGNAQGRRSLLEHEQ